MKQKKETHAQSHCERSVAIAGLSNRTDNAITTQTSFARNDKRRAFTLAEVLITLAIIGVVAAMTIPTLISSYKEKQTVSQLLKIQSTLSHAFKMAEVEYGPISTWGLTSTNTGKIDSETGKSIYDTSAQREIAQRIKPYLRVNKTCVQDEMCYPYPGYSLSGIKLNDNYIAGSGNTPPEALFYLNDGTFIQLGWYSQTAKKIDISVTLPDNKSVLGKNRFFFFHISEKGIFPEGLENPPVTVTTSNFETNCNPSFENTLSGRYCTAWVIQNKNMDYLHCADELSWSGKHQCSD